MNKSMKRAIEEISRAGTIAIGSHVEPDPDCIGSMLGLGLGLQSLGKKIFFVNDHEMPHNTLHILGEIEILRQLPEGIEINLFIGVDSSDLERLGNAAQPFFSGNTPTVIIDHHKTNTGFGVVNITDSSAASTAEMIPAFLDALGVKITPEIADCLLTGMLADTLGFSTESVTPETLKTAAQLLELGGDLTRLYSITLKEKPLALMKLWGVGLSHLQSEDGLVWAAITREEREALGIGDDLNHNLASQIRNIKEGQVFAVFAERDDGTTSISLRSKPGYDVSWIAFELGGGGHQAAAGATIESSLSDAIEIVLPLMRREYRKENV